jgi:peptidoglycan biosynthesis protein MviN/MurJ (putative lipid II flippase)
VSVRWKQKGASIDGCTRRGEFYHRIFLPVFFEDVKQNGGMAIAQVIADAFGLVAAVIGIVLAVGIFSAMIPGILGILYGGDEQ